MRSRVAIVLLALAATACAKSSGVMVAAQNGPIACADMVYRGPAAGGGPVVRPITDRSGEPTGFLASSLIVGLISDPSQDGDTANPFDLYLDCLVGEIDPRDAEKRLLRGHVLVTMLAMYADFNLRRQRYAGLEDDAALIVRSIENAELALAAGSRLVLDAALGGDARPDTLLASYGRVSRVVDVLQVALDVERPTQVRGLDGLRHLAAAVASGGTDVVDLVLDGLRGIRKAAILEVYGGALRTDAGRFLRSLDGRAVTLADWQAWDRWLDQACARIAAVGGLTNRCVPRAQALAAYLDAPEPPSRRRSAMRAEATAVMR